jgi:hypothetical protein
MGRSEMAVARPAGVELIVARPVIDEDASLSPTEIREEPAIPAEAAVSIARLPRPRPTDAVAFIAPIAPPPPSVKEQITKQEVLRLNKPAASKRRTELQASFPGQGGPKAVLPRELVLPSALLPSRPPRSGVGP